MPKLAINKNLKSGTGGKANGYTVYLHFSFRKPAGEKYALFSTACFFDREFTKLITKHTTADILWEPESQHVNSVQSYYKALEYIYNNQADMIRNGISNVVLVTSNSSLVNWIMNRGRNKYYNSFVDSVSKPFRFGGSKAINVGVGLLEAVDTEKSKKYCKEKNADNLKIIKERLESEGKEKTYKMRIKEPTMVKTIFDIMKEEAPKFEDSISEIER